MVPPRRHVGGHGDLEMCIRDRGTPCAAAIAALWTITGNLDVPGGMCYTASPMGVDQPSAGAWGIYDLINEEMQKKRVGWKEFPMYRYGLTQACLLYTSRAKTGKPGSERTDHAQRG